MSPLHALPPRHLQVSGLCCRRGERLLFEDLDFTVEPGEILLLRGPNGAGKTTLLLALAGIVRPEAGRIAIAGGEAEGGTRDVHLLAHLPGLKGRLTVEREPALLGRPERRRPGPGRRRRSRRSASPGSSCCRPAISRRDKAAGWRWPGCCVADRPVWLLDEPTAALDRDGETAGRHADRRAPDARRHRRRRHPPRPRARRRRASRRCCWGAPR